MPTELHVLTPHIEVPRSTHRNAQNRAIEAICRDMGINPKTITDATTPTASPADVATALDMFATILKSQTQAPTPAVTAHWYSGAVPRRTMLGGGGGGSTIPSGASDNFIKFGARSITTTENLSYCIASFSGTVRALKIETLTSQPAGGQMFFILRINGVDINTISQQVIVTVNGSDAAQVYTASIVGTTTVQAGDFISLVARNYNAGASAQVGSFTLEFDQNG